MAQYFNLDSFRSGVLTEVPNPVEVYDNRYQRIVEEYQMRDIFSSQFADCNALKWKYNDMFNSLQGTKSNLVSLADQLLTQYLGDIFNKSLTTEIAGDELGYTENIFYALASGGIINDDFVSGYSASNLYLYPSINQIFDQDVLSNPPFSSLYSTNRIQQILTMYYQAFDWSASDARKHIMSSGIVQNIVNSSIGDIGFKAGRCNVEKRRLKTQRDGLSAQKDAFLLEHPEDETIINQEHDALLNVINQAIQHQEGIEAKCWSVFHAIRDNFLSQIGGGEYGIADAAVSMAYGRMFDVYRNLVPEAQVACDGAAGISAGWNIYFYDQEAKTQYKEYHVQNSSIEITERAAASAKALLQVAINSGLTDLTSYEEAVTAAEGNAAIARQQFEDQTYVPYTTSKFQAQVDVVYGYNKLYAELQELIQQDLIHSSALSQIIGYQNLDPAAEAIAFAKIAAENA